MFSGTGTRSRAHERHDSGAALALVLLMVVILGLWLGAMAVLGQSTSSAVTQNVQRSNARAALVSEAVSQALKELNAVDANGQLIGTKDNHCESSPTFTGVYTDPSTGGVVRVDCVQSQESGQTQPVGAIILSGGGCAAGACREVGVDAGLAIDGQGTLSVAGGGLVNASCQFTLVNTSQVVLMDAKSKIRVPAVCSAQAFSAPSTFSPSFGNASAVDLCTAVGSKCEPSEDYSLDRSNGQLVSYMTGMSRRTSLKPNSELAQPKIDGKYLNQLGTSTCAQLAKSVPAADTATGSLTQSVQAVRISPGLWKDADIDTLTLFTDGSRGCGYGASGQPIVYMEPGLYRFSSSAARTLAIHGTSLVGGAPVFDAGTGQTWTCATGASGQGVEVQISGNVTVDVGGGGATGGRFILCPQNKDTPVFSAINADLLTSANVPLSVRQDQAVIDQRSTPLLKLNKTNSCSGSCTAPEFGVTNGVDWAKAPSNAWLSDHSYIQFRGYALAPGGAVYLDTSGIDSANFTKGAMFKAMSIHATGAAASSPSVSPPSAYNGDRFIQLRFWCVSGPYCPSDTPDSDRDLGIVQLLIRDRFGAEPGAAYEVLLWRTMW